MAIYQSDRNVLLWHNKFLKRTLDLVVSSLGLILFGWLILLAFIIATIDTKQFGFFIQDRVGRSGKIFRILKIRTMKKVDSIDTTVTTASDARITTVGRLFRKTKIDELPQLFNVFLGQMSLVGPRPDVPGFADCLDGESRNVLKIRPGITGPATIAFRNEEELLAKQENPEEYNSQIIFPEKVRLNLEYMDNYSFLIDLKYIFRTIFE